MSSCWRYAGKRSRYWLYGRMAWVSAPKKSSYQTPISPRSTGRFCSNGAVRKCSSIGVEAGEHLAELLGPDRDHERQADRRVVRVAAADPVPEAEHVRGVDAELAHLSSLVDTATKCFATAGLSSARRAPASSQSRAVCAFVSVSSVVNVFEQTTNSVSSGSRSCTDSQKSVPSTLETKRNVMSRCEKSRSAS